MPHTFKNTHVSVHGCGFSAQTHSYRTRRRQLNLASSEDFLQCKDMNTLKKLFTMEQDTQFGTLMTDRLSKLTEAMVVSRKKVTTAIYIFLKQFVGSSGSRVS